MSRSLFTSVVENKRDHITMVNRKAIQGGKTNVVSFFKVAELELAIQQEAAGDISFHSPLPDYLRQLVGVPFPSTKEDKKETKASTVAKNDTTSSSRRRKKVEGNSDGTKKGQDGGTGGTVPPEDNGHGSTEERTGDAEAGV